MHDPSKEGEKTSFECPFCKMTFELQKEMQNHVSSIHQGLKPYTCSLCNLAFSQKGNLKKHIRSKHDPEKVQIKKPFQCSLCEMTFNLKGSLKRHIMEKHDEIKPFTCLECGVSFPRNEYLKYHIAKVHEGKMPEEVDPNIKKEITESSNSQIDNDLMYKVQAELANNPDHENMVKQEENNKPSICLECGDNFLSNEELKRHIAEVHEGKNPEAPFPCEICGNFFTSMSSVKKHIATVHLGIKVIYEGVLKTDRLRLHLWYKFIKRPRKTALGCSPFMKSASEIACLDF